MEASEFPDIDLGLMTISEFARKFRVEPGVIRWWIKKGFVQSIRVGPRQVQMLRPSEVVVEVVPAGALLGDFDAYPLSPIYMRMPVNANRQRDATKVSHRRKA